MTLRLKITLKSIFLTLTFHTIAHIFSFYVLFSFSLCLNHCILPEILFLIHEFFNYYFIKSIDCSLIHFETIGKTFKWYYSFESSLKLFLWFYTLCLFCWNFYDWLKENFISLYCKSCILISDGYCLGSLPFIFCYVFYKIQKKYIKIYSHVLDYFLLLVVANIYFLIPDNKLIGNLLRNIFVLILAKTNGMLVFCLLVSYDVFIWFWC